MTLNKHDFLFSQFANTTCTKQSYLKQIVEYFGNTLFIERMDAQPNFKINPEEPIADEQLKKLKSLAHLLVREIELISTPKQNVGGEVLFNLLEEMQKFEINMIRCALLKSMGQQKRAAELLGLKTNTLCEKIKRYNIN